MQITLQKKYLTTKTKLSKNLLTLKVKLLSNFCYLVFKYLRLKSLTNILKQKKLAFFITNNIYIE